MEVEATPTPAITWSPECAEIFAAMAKAQASMGRLTKGKSAEVRSKDTKQLLYTYAYTDLPSTLEACLHAYNEQGCSILQPTRVYGNGVDVTTVITHSSGQWVMSAPLFLPIKFTGAQDAGGGITYARRYGLQAMTGQSPADDDGKHAHDNPPPPAQRAAPIQNQRQKAQPPSRGYLDLEGPRCSGRAAHIATSNRDRVKELARLTGVAKGGSIWKSVLDEAKIADVITPKGPACPTAAQLLTDDGKRVKAMLNDRIADCQVDREPGDDGDEQEPLELDPPGAP